MNFASTQRRIAKLLCQPLHLVRWLIANTGQLGILSNSMMKVVPSPKTLVKSIDPL